MTKKTNSLGLYDMAGNVWEWVEDMYSSDAYSKHQRNNPISTESGFSGLFDELPNLVIQAYRGGSWFIKPGELRAANRGKNAPAYRDDVVGFRLARTP